MPDTRSPTSQLFDVTGRHALVTGGTRGIGFMIARGLAAAGARVLITSRKAAACAAAERDLADVGDVLAIPADVADPAGIGALRAAVTDRFGGRLDVLVNNAGATWGAPLDGFPESGWDKVMDTNVRGVFQLTVALLGALRSGATADGPARIINIGSVAGISVGDLDNYPYTASKAAVHMLTRHLAARLAREAITVNAIAPGHFESKMSEFLLADPEARQQVEAQVPLGRIGEPDDIVGATLLLASRAGAYITGSILSVDGGLVGCR